MFQVKLEEQEEKSNTLSEVNSVLRDQLDKAVDNNSNLIEDLKRLASDWEKLNRELVDRVSEVIFCPHNRFHCF
jgi:rootletin